MDWFPSPHLLSISYLTTGFVHLFLLVCHNMNQALIPCSLVCASRVNWPLVCISLNVNCLLSYWSSELTVPWAGLSMRMKEPDCRVELLQELYYLRFYFELNWKFLISCILFSGSRVKWCAIASYWDTLYFRPRVPKCTACFIYVLLWSWEWQGTS